MYQHMKLKLAGLVHAQLTIMVCCSKNILSSACIKSPAGLRKQSSRPFRSCLQIWIVDNITVIGAGYWYAHPTLYNWHVLSMFRIFKPLMNVASVLDTGKIQNLHFSPMPSCWAPPKTTEKIGENHNRHKYQDCFFLFWFIVFTSTGWTSKHAPASKRVLQAKQKSRAGE